MTPPHREALRFNVLRNALYHTACRRTFEGINRIFSFLIILLGAAAVGNFQASWHIPLEVNGLLIAVIGALQLVFNFGGRARDHQSLQRDYYRLLAEIEGNPKAEEAQSAEWYADMIRICAEEPPTLRALDAKAYNDAHAAIDFGPMSDHLFIPWHHRLLGRFFAFEGHFYQKHSERHSGAGAG